MTGSVVIAFDLQCILYFRQNNHVLHDASAYYCHVTHLESARITHQFLWQNESVGTTDLWGYLVRCSLSLVILMQGAVRAVRRLVLKGRVVH